MYPSPYLYSEHSESHDAVIVLLLSFLRGELQASYQIDFTSLLELAPFSVRVKSVIINEDEAAMINNSATQYHYEIPL